VASHTTQVRRALAALLDDLDARVTPAGTDFATDNGFDTNKYTVRIRVGPDTEPTAEHLDRLLDSDGDESIKRRLEADPTLGGLVSQVRILKSSGYQIYPGDLLGTTFTVQTL
jgi:hypothetical protein